jgi:uncharacterized Zn finger protein
VAVVAEYLEQIALESEIPLADENDRRWAKLRDETADDHETDDDELDDEFEENTKKPAAKPTQRRSRTDWNERIRQHIAAKSREDLVDLVFSLTERFPELHEEFRERIALGEGDVDRLVAEARKELRRVTSETGWSNHWSGEGHTPDFTKLKHRLERMAELGHPDAVVKLGSEIIERGMELVERSNDEGETATELAACMPSIFDSVAQASLPPAKKLLFVIDAYLQDGFDIIGDTADIVMEQKFPPEVWSKVADELAARLKSGAASDRDYHRDQISGWLATALENAGRSGEIVALYEREARTTASYQRLVHYLLELKRYEDANRWACEGIEKTIEKLPGIATSLGKALGELAKSQRKWEVVAAHAAWEFFDSPGEESFKQLVTAASKAHCEEQVRTAAITFLETGKRPIHMDADGKNARQPKIDAAWPLPVPDYLASLLKSARTGPRDGPHYGVLIAMAISDKRHDDVLKWYDRLRADKKQGARYGWYGRDHADQVAEAVAKTHPERSLEIYRQRVNDNLSHAGLGAYETVAAYLRKMRPILKSLAREPEWNQLVADIRLRHRNRPRFMEILDTLENKTILQSQRDRR